MEYKTLIEKAIEAKKMSYSPYSNFSVGAALLTKDGKIYTGCNIESVAYSPTNCAERTAIFKAVSEGYKEFSAIAIVGSLKEKEGEYCYPCGVCRQVISEFVKPADFEVIVAKNLYDYKIYKFQEILPFPFDSELN